MKKLICFALLVSCLGRALCQQDSVRVWNKYCGRKDTMLLFTTANNLIQIHSATLKAADIKVKSLDWSLRIGTPEVKGDTISLMAMPYPNKSKTMRIAIINAKTNKTIKTVSFSSDNVPPLVARVGKITTTEAPRLTILSQMVLSAVFPNSLYSYPYKIKQFTFKIYSAKGGATISIMGNTITNDMLQQIKDAPAGTVMEFTNIKATCPECATRTLDDVKLKIK